MNGFRPLRDPLWILALAVYGVNCCWFQGHVDSLFLRGHFNDLLFVPAALPCVLAAQRWLGLRASDAPATLREVTFHVLVWSVVCEGIGPAWLHVGTGDPLDVACYAIGGLLAWAWWNRHPALGTAPA